MILLAPGGNDGTTTTTTTTESPAGLVYEASESGAFSATASWKGGVVPRGDCSVVIPTGITITFTGTLLNVNIRTLTISGTFTVVTTETIGFGFAFAVNLLVRSGGTLRDQTNNNRIYTRADSVITFLSGASFTGNNTQVFIFTGTAPGEGVGASVTFGSSISGPYTFGALVDGSVQTFRSVMCLARRSGSFTTGSTWLGGVAPTTDFCGSAGGCDLYVPTGFTLSTESLNGVLNIRFNVLIITSGATLQLGAAGLTAGFRFSFTVTLNNYGILQDVTGSSGGIFLVTGSNFNFFAGGSFSSAVATALRIYDSTTGATTGTSLTLSASFSGPLFVSVSSTGQISTSTTSKEDCLSLCSISVTSASIYYCSIIN